MNPTICPRVRAGQLHARFLCMIRNFTVQRLNSATNVLGDHLISPDAMNLKSQRSSSAICETWAKGGSAKNFQLESSVTRVQQKVYVKSFVEPHAASSCCETARRESGLNTSCRLPVHSLAGCGTSFPSQQEILQNPDQVTVWWSFKRRCGSGTWSGQGYGYKMVLHGKSRRRAQ